MSRLPALIPLFVLSFAAQAFAEPTAPNWSPRQQEILSTVLAVDGRLTKGLYDEFWTLSGPVAKNQRAREAVARMIEETILLGQTYQQAVWMSARESFLQGRVIELKTVQEIEERMRQTTVYRDGGYDGRAAVERSFKSTDRLLASAAFRTALMTPRGPATINLEMIDQVLAGISGSVCRVTRLAAPEWSES